ncbi:hypothetical protein ACJ41O_007675 [Fusarium nematophilum]
MVETLDVIRKSLTKVNRYAGTDVGKKEEVKEALMDIHVKLLGFWVKVAKELRKNPIAKAVEWRLINESLNNVVMEIQGHYESIKEIAESDTVARELAWRRACLKPELTFPVFVLPLPENPDFFGREDTIQRVHDHLDPAKRKPKLGCFTIFGMGGIGKTQVAASYAYRYCRNVEDSERSYDAVFWVGSETKVAMRQSFFSIASTLKLPGIGDTSDPATVVAAVHLWLKQTDKRWLLIFDNVERWDDVMPEFWPQAGAAGSVMITSRDFSLANRPASAGEQLQTFTTTESSEFAKSILKDWDSEADEEKEALGQLLAKLDGLPLAIHQISSLINAEGSCIVDFLDLYKEHADEFHEDRGGDHEAFYSHTLETVWLVAINAFSRDPAAQLLLGSISLLSPDAIPEKLFQARKGLSLPDDARIYHDRMVLRKTLISLRSSGIIAVSKSTIRIHRLVQSAFIKQVELGIQARVFEITSTLLNDVFPKQIHGDPLYDQWPACSKYVLHTQTLARNWRTASQAGLGFPTPPDFLELLCHAAWYFREVSDFESAAELVEIGLEASRGQQTAITAHLLNTSGVIKELTYQYSPARKVLEECLDIRLKILGADHLETNGVKTNLASIMAAQGDYSAALRLYREAEEASTGSSAQEKRLSSCRYAANYGRCFTELGEYAKARLSLERARDILNSGTDNLVYRRAIEYCFGNLDLAEKKFGDARASYQRCLGDYSQEILEKNTLLTCGSYYKLSLLESHLDNQELAYDRSVEADADSSEHLTAAMKLAQKTGAQGYVGRILLLKLEFVQKNRGQINLWESGGEIELKIKAVRNNLAAQLCGQDIPQDSDKIFGYFIPWQAR